MWDNFLPSSSLHSLKGADAGNGIRVFVPDIGMFIASLTIWLVCRTIVKKPDTEEIAQLNSECENEELVSLNTCVFLLQSILLWGWVESVCRALSAWGTSGHCCYVGRLGEAAGQTLMSTPCRWGHRWLTCDSHLSWGPHRGVRNSLTVLSSPQWSTGLTVPECYVRWPSLESYEQSMTVHLLSRSELFAGYFEK